MPVGSFYRPTSDPDARGGMTGTGAPSQPKGGMSGSGGMADYSGWEGVPVTVGAGYKPGMATPVPVPQGASPGSTYGLSPSPSTLSPFTSAAMGLGPLTDLVSAIYGPQQTLLDQALARQYDQLGMIGVNADHDRSVLTRDNALANQLLGLDQQALGIDKNLTNTQLSNLGRLRAILDQQRGLVGERKDLDTAVAKDTAERKTFDLRSDLTARGAFNTVANERGTGRINRDLIYSLEGIDQTYRNSLLGLDEKGISYDNQQAALQAKLANIGLDASRLDISQQQLENALADGLYNIGLGEYTSVSEVVDMINGTNTQKAALATQILQTIIGYSDLPPDVINQIFGLLGIGTSNTSGSYSNTTGTSGGQRTGGNYGS